MELTNKFGLPETLVSALKADPYQAVGDISVTTLIDSPRIRMLKRHNQGKIEEDVSNMLWALMGSAVHTVLERANINNVRKQAFLTVLETLNEEAKGYTGEYIEVFQDVAKKLIKMMERFFPEVEGRYIFETRLSYEFEGKILSGQFDLYDKIEKCLYDYKLTSVYNYINPESRKKWAAQTNIYAFMLRNEGYEVDKIKVVAIFRDWSRSKAALYGGNYPVHQFMTIPIIVAGQQRMEEWIQTRMKLHFEAEKEAAITGTFPLCNGEDRWATSDQYAVIANGMRKALRVFDTEDMAKQYILKEKYKHLKELYIEHRPGKSIRCDYYCPVREVCDQRKEINEKIALTNQYKTFKT
jgi:hypothetical protein